MTSRRVCVAVVGALMLSACSSRPREFVATLAAPPADQTGFDAANESCRTLVAQGYRSGFGARIASAGAGVAGVGAGLAVGAGVGAATAGTGAGMAAAGAAISTALVMVPVLGVAAAWGLSKNRKLKKEREIKSAMKLCLSEQGYAVDGWRKAKRRGKTVAGFVRPSRPSKPLGRA